MRRVVMIAVVLAFGCSAPPAGVVQPSDYAYGTPFDAPAGQPFVRVEPPDATYAETAWPDLRDIRVFNAAGEPVPFARIARPPTQSDARRVPLRPFRLETAVAGQLPRIEFDATGRGVGLRVAPGAVPETGVEYLLAAPEPDTKTRIGRLLMVWPASDTNWQQTVTVSASSDLQSWRTVAVRRPIMDLQTADGERLVHGEIAIEPTTLADGRYWRVRFDPGYAPSLSAVEGETTTEDVPAPGVPIPGRLRVQADGSVVFQLDRPQPIARLRVRPAEPNSVLPLFVEGRESPESKWALLAGAVAFRINADGSEQQSEPIDLRGQSVESFRLRPIGTTWGSSPPVVAPERDATILVVNTRGAGPFLLAWGNRAATDASVDLSILVPGGRAVVSTLDNARLGDRQELGGELRLTALAPAERAARWQTALVWLALVGGALALAFLAWRLLKETRRQT